MQTNPKRMCKPGKIALSIFFSCFFIFSSCQKDESLLGIETNEIGNIKGTSIFLSGNHLSKFFFYERGIIWGENKNLATSGKKEIAMKTSSYYPYEHYNNYDSRTTVFEVLLTGLKPGTTYYYRAYAVNDHGTGYGKVLSFTTNSDDFLEIQKFFKHGAYSAGISFHTLPDGYVNEEGICWGERPQPDLTDSVMIGYIHHIKVLKSETQIYVRRYAKMKNGEVLFGNPKSFTTGKIELDSLSFISSRSFLVYLTAEPGVEKLEYYPGIEYSLDENFPWDSSIRRFRNENKELFIRFNQPSTTYYLRPFILAENPYPLRETGNVTTITSPPLPVIGEGTFENPYTTDGALYVRKKDQAVWIEGYIAGTTNSRVCWQRYIDSHYYINHTGPFATYCDQFEILLSEEKGEKYFGNTLLVNLLEGEIANQLNLVNNPSNLHKKIRIKGILNNSMTSVSEYTFVSGD